MTTQDVYDKATLPSDEDAELWLREVRAEFPHGAVETESIGIAIDGETTFGEAAEASAPFIFLAVARIVLLTSVYREELQVQPTRLAAVRWAGEGTGGALVLSALTSVLGFAVMALAPTPNLCHVWHVDGVMIGLSVITTPVCFPAFWCWSPRPGSRSGPPCPNPTRIWCWITPSASARRSCRSPVSSGAPLASDALPPNGAYLRCST